MANRYLSLSKHLNLLVKKSINNLIPMCSEASVFIITDERLLVERNYSSQLQKHNISRSLNSLMASHLSACNLQRKSFDCLGFFNSYEHLNEKRLYLPNWNLASRSIHTSSRDFKDESKVEKVVKSLKDEEKLKEEKVPNKAVTAAPVTEVQPSIGKRIMHELRHYYHGFRLLFIDVKICLRYIWKIVNGNSLTRRERRQLVRTTADMFRLVPFLVIILIPFMELALPVIVRLFPNMLPSTFEAEDKKQEKVKKKLKAKLEVAKFLQDTIEESALQTRGKSKENTSQDFVEFMNKIRSTGSLTSNQEILRFSKLFEDEITLDNMTRSQLAALCQVLELPRIGTTAFLRLQLELKLRQLKADDKMIVKEGVEILTTSELQAACRARGMRALGLSEERLRSQLNQWLDLHLHENIPTSLLLLSRALYLPETLSTPEQIKATISALPESTTEEAKIKAAELSGAKLDNRALRERIEKEEQILREEEIERKVEQLKLQSEEAVRGEALADKAPQMTPKPEEVIEIESGDLEKLESVLDNLASEKKISMEEEELEELKEDVSEYKEDLEDLQEVVRSSDSKQQLRESRAARLLGRRVELLIGQLDRSMSQLKEEHKQMLDIIEEDEVRMEESECDEKRDQLKTDIERKRNMLVSLEEVLASVRKVQVNVTDDSRLEQLVQALDEDKDGVLSLDEVYKVIELVGTEQVKLPASQLRDLAQLVQREEILEDMEKEEERQKRVQEGTSEERLSKEQSEKSKS